MTAQTPTAAPLARSNGHAPPLVPAVVFGGKRLVVVGGTGFLGKVWVAMALARFPELEHLYLLVRAKKGQTPEERFWSQIVTSPTFDPVRDAHPGTAFEAFVRTKITPIAGDVVLPDLGLDPGLIETLAGNVDAVVNVAGVVDFNPPLDEALEVNAFGVNNLVSLAKRLRAPILHTSTCYVAGYRSGLIDEVDPREVPFPRSEGKTWFGAATKAMTPGGHPTHERVLDRGHWDPQREIEECLDLVKQARQRCEDAFRQTYFLDQAKANLEARGEPARGAVLEGELAKVKRRFVEDQLTAAGKERALYWGWTNIYTYTKSIGEQVLAASGVPYTIARPAVVESAVEFPFCGWNEGVNTSAPYLYMALKGQVQFPGSHEVHLDIIPVDMVCGGMFASLAELLEGRAKAVYQYGTTDTNGCRMTRYMELAGLYKRRQVREGKRTRLQDVVMQYFESLGMTKAQYDKHGAHAIARAMRGASGLLERFTMGPLRPVLRPAVDALASAATAEDKVGDVIDLFLPFTSENDWIFSCANTRAAIERVPEAERWRFTWRPHEIDWRWWMMDCHLPGLEKWVFPELDDRLRRELKPLRPFETLVDLLDEMGDRHGHAVALQELGSEGLSRTTYLEWRRASTAVAGRLAALGVRRGDRVALSGKNHPAWPIAYFGILRAGGVAVPIDPDLDGARFTNVVRSSGAAVGLWDAGVEERAGEAVRRALVDFRSFDLQRFADGELDGADGATAEEAALAAPTLAALALGPDDLASVIYTSGTTGDPKGVMLTHGNFTNLLAALAPLFPLGPDDRVLSVLPLHHTFEFSCGLLLPLSRGARIIYIPERTAEALGRGLREGRVTAMVGVPALWQLLERRIESRVKERGPVASRVFDLGLEVSRVLGEKTGVNTGRLFFHPVHMELGGRVRWLISGGAALPKDTADTFRALGLPLSEGYGLTEAAPVLTVQKATVGTRPGSVGKPVPGVEIDIRDPDARGVGEVVARGPNVMKGYAENEAATRAVFTEDGWLKTGDLGKLDKKGRLVLVGRAKEVIVAANGENVYPDDVEDMLGDVRGIRELSIVGIDDGRGGERVACLAVPEAEAEEEGGPPSSGPQAGRRLARHERAQRALREAFERLPVHCRPAVVHLWDAELPRTPTRKVKRAEVKQILSRLAQATSVPPPSAGGAAVSGVVRRAVAAIAGKAEAEIVATSSFRGDLAFDSLLAMELHSALEASLGRSLDAEALGKCETVAELEQHLVREGLTRPERGGAAASADEEEPLPKLPSAVAEPIKDAMRVFQMGFYERVMDPTVTGRAFIPQNRNAIVVSNHSSHLDMGFVKWALGDYGKDIVSLAAQDYFFEGKWKRAYFENLTNLEPFDRKGGLRQAIRQALDVIERGRTVLIFPEGTRSPDGRIQEFKPVVGHLALVSRTDILPVWIDGTFQAMKKGSRIPTRRKLLARIGPPLRVADLERLTEGMKPSAAHRKVAELAEFAVRELAEGRVFDLSRQEAKPGAPQPKPEHPLVVLFRELEGRFDASRLDRPITFYFTLGTEDLAKWTLRVAPDGCAARPGKPEGAGQADCVLKTTPEIFTKIVREAYVPGPMEFLSGQVKSNDISLLQTFQKVFHLS